jgi:hypothetical protein
MAQVGAADFLSDRLLGIGKLPFLSRIWCIQGRSTP